MYFNTISDDEPVAKPAATKDGDVASSFKQPKTAEILSVQSKQNDNDTKHRQNMTYMNDVLEKCKFFLEGSSTGEHLMSKLSICLPVLLFLV